MTRPLLTKEEIGELCGFCDVPSLCCCNRIRMAAERIARRLADAPVLPAELLQAPPLTSSPAAANALAVALFRWVEPEDRDPCAETFTSGAPHPEPAGPAYAAYLGDADRMLAEVQAALEEEARGMAEAALQIGATLPTTPEV